jgi:hypothetical protein
MLKRVKDRVDYMKMGGTTRVVATTRVVGACRKGLAIQCSAGFGLGRFLEPFAQGLLGDA